MTPLNYTVKEVLWGIFVKKLKAPYMKKAILVTVSLYFIFMCSTSAQVTISQCANAGSTESEACCLVSLPDITAVEVFTALQELYLMQNDIKEIDVRNLGFLEVLEIDRGNDRTEIDLSSNLSLRILRLGSNDLASLDIRLTSGDVTKTVKLIKK